MRRHLLTSTIMLGALIAAPAFAQSQAGTDTGQTAQTSPMDPSSAAAAAQARSQSNGDNAQRTSSPDSQPGQTNPGSSAQGVVVTGSRLKRNAFTSPDPITVINADQAALAGYADTASLLQQSSIAAGSFQTNDQLTGFVVTGGPGSKTLNLRRLGAQRTVILLDGRRLGPAGVGGTVGPVDLNVIPQSSVQRIEVLKDGASSIYGSDAVAGVVNIITKKNRDGAELTAYHSASQHGGGDVYTISGDYGKTFDKGYFELSGEFYQQQRVARGQRDYTNCSEDYLFNPSTGARVDYTAGATPNYGHLYKCYNQTNNDIGTSLGTLQYLQPGVVYPTAAQGNNVPTTVSTALGGPLNTFFARQARAGYPLTYPYANYYSRYTDRASIISPDMHYNVTANLGYDLTSSAHLYGQFLFSDRVSKQTAARQLFPTFSSAWVAGNPNNIFAGTGVTPIQPIISLPYDSFQNVKYYRGVVGMNGDITGLGWFNRFSYDVFGTYSRSSGNYSVDQIYNDRVLATTTSAAGCTTVGVTNLSNYNCGSLPSTGIPWLSSRVLAGNFTDAERQFLFFRAHSKTNYDQYILEASLTGDLFTLPAGAVSSAIGVSYRHDKIDDQPDPQIQANNLWGFSASGHTVGSDSVKEAFVEIGVPLIKNVPAIQSLSLDVSGRYSDYESYGSTGTYKVSGNWTVIPDLRFRGSIGTSFRAPALYELYLAHQTSFSGQGTVDPCYNYGAGTAPATVKAACAALGIPSDYLGVQNPGGGASAQISTGGGLANLKAETSRAQSVGVIISPKEFGIDRLANLSVAVDYFNFRVNNEVRTLGSSNIITQCLQGNSAFCGLFVRDLNPSSPTYFNILTVNNNYVNVATQRVRGLDLTLHADHNFGAYGKLLFDANLTWTFANKFKLLPTAPITNRNGTTFNYEGPDFAGNASMQYDYQDWSVFWYVQALGKGSDTEEFAGDVFANSRYQDIPNGIGLSSNCAAANNDCTYYKQYVDVRIYHDLSVRKRFPAVNAEFTAGVRNVFDEEPPAQSAGQFRSGLAALNAYDIIGRSFFLRLTKRW